MVGNETLGYGSTGRESGWSARLRGGGRGRLVAIAGAALLGLLVLYYAIGMAVVHEIDDDADFAPAVLTEGGSRAVDMAAALIGREVDVNGWTANDPFFLPGSLLDNMPHFQQGMAYALGRFTIDLSDQIGRARGSSQMDADLERASGLLKYPGTVWIFDFSTSLAPTASSESQYRAARRALLAYNQRLAQGQAVFDRRADNLIAVTERVANDLGSLSGAIDWQVDNAGGWLVDTQADDVFYTSKGQLYAYYMILKSLGEDYGPLVEERQLGAVWGQMLDSFRQAAALQPLVVVNGAPDSQAQPSHLAAQGFYLLRARTQLSEVANVLSK
ncbi:MAG TPA: DUF2333 family protein [Arenibaculum sp.]|nr:DUF2333 family protein [Arenibaculum sp.]